MPLLTALAGMLVAGERPSRGFWVLSLAGTLAVLVYTLIAGAGSTDLQWADLLLAGAAVCGSTATRSAASSRAVPAAPW